MGTVPTPGVGSLLSLEVGGPLAMNEKSVQMPL